MNDLFAAPPVVRRSPAAITVSLLLHGLALAALAVVGVKQVFSPRVNAPTNITFMAFAPPHPPVEVPAARAATPEPVIPLERPPAPSALTVLTPVPVEVRIPEPPPPEPPPAPKAVPPPPRPPVTVGAFASSASVAPTTAPRATVQVAGFDTAAAVAPDLGLKQAAVGAFDSAPKAQPRPGTDRPGVVAAGFEGSRGSAPAAAPVGQVTASGFGTAAPAGPQASSGRRDAVRAGGFGDATAPAPAQGQPQAVRVEPNTTPVEVLSKPTPAYTDEARALKIEGDVVLEVEFATSGQVRVLRVVRGLGHGLDDMAAQAAAKIKFKPATSGGRPVDFRANVTILFRLT